MVRPRPDTEAHPHNLMLHWDCPFQVGLEALPMDLSQSSVPNGLFLFLFTNFVLFILKEVIGLRDLLFCLLIFVEKFLCLNSCPVTIFFKHFSLVQDVSCLQVK